jgi:hypothetical protein
MVVGVNTAGNPGKSNWGGYIASNQAGASQMVVSGTFVLPSSYQYVAAPNGGSDAVSIWTGIGGWNFINGNKYLWQAGVVITVNSANSPSIYPFYEEVDANLGCCPQWNLGWSGFQVSPGDTIRAQVLHAAYGPMFNITDGASWATRKWSTLWEFCPWGPVNYGDNPAKYCIDHFVPDTSTNDWIVEAPTAAGASNPCGVPASSLCVLPNYGTFTFPAGSMAATNYAGWAMPVLREVGDSYFYNGVEGYTNPGLLISDYPSGRYGDQYGTAPVG